MNNVIAAMAIAFAATNADIEARCFHHAEWEKEVTAMEAEVAELKNESDRIHAGANRMRMQAKYDKEGYETFRYSPDGGFKKVTMEGFAHARESEMKAIEMLNEAERVRNKAERLSAKVARMRRQAEAHRHECESN